MKITILENQPVEETEIEIRCQKADESVSRLLSFLNIGIQKIKAYQGDMLCLIDPKEVYYFESVDKNTFVYLEKSVLETPLKLYEVMGGVLLCFAIKNGKVAIHMGNSG